ncbi:hypothetical protein TRAPUB_11171 [Trametes pubescens]|uniref:Velvet domain-containing protein n=1 Tax=Trametes pubescens TaxID=154538 RepID=A0A1M2VXG5_TRAPU|nr:hypothetical protein TRAPUB_11171 [Trametes pubescens]
MVMVLTRPCPVRPAQRPRALNTLPNQPASFTSGLLAGLTVRIEIEETQKADLGRKYARKDKRPLDPPPVVICTFRDLTNAGAPGFREQALQIETATLGAVCHVDLFPVPPDYEDYIAAKPPVSWPLPLQRLTDGILPSTHASASSLPPPSAIMQGLLPPMPPPEYYVPFHSATTGRYPEAPSSLYPSPMAVAHGQNAMLPGVQSLTAIAKLPCDPRQVPTSQFDSPDVVAWFGSHAIRESDKCSSMLAGATFVQAEIVDYNGKKEAMFVFSDLAVKVEGTFVLRYRTMNLTSQTGTSRPFRVLAECFGGPFKVYSTKEFPGLPPSTALTKVSLRSSSRHPRPAHPPGQWRPAFHLLSMYGIRVNMRENERKRRTKSEIDAEASEQALPARRGGATALELVVQTAAAGAASPTRMAQYSPTSTTSVASSSASVPGPYARTRARGLSRGSAHGMYGGHMDTDERGAEY